MQQRDREVTPSDYYYQYVAYNPPESVHMCGRSAGGYIETTSSSFLNPGMDLQGIVNTSEYPVSKECENIRN